MDAEALHLFVQGRGADAQAGRGAALVPVVKLEGVKYQTAFKFPDESAKVARMSLCVHRSSVL
jgi:hypothetical protein